MLIIEQISHFLQSLQWLEVMEMLQVFWDLEDNSHSMDLVLFMWKGLRIQASLPKKFSVFT